MKRIIVTTIIAVFLSAINLSAQQEKATYIIDGKKIENFNGSQLKGKTITSYTLNDNVHVIYTTDYDDQATDDVKVIAVTTKRSNNSNGESIKLRGADGKEIVYVIDGIVTSAEKFTSMSTSDIHSVSVIRSEDNPEFKKYANENTYAVIVVFTKK